MLEIKTATNLYDIENILKENNFQMPPIDISNSMVIYDNNIAIAAAGFEQEGDLGIIRFVAVKKNRQREYLGDGILKALLNLAEKKGIRRMLVDPEKKDQFFKKVGMKKVFLTELKEYEKSFIDYHFSNKGSILEAILPDFFLTACKSNK